jgi:hypothetical protein
MRLCRVVLVPRSSEDDQAFDIVDATEWRVDRELYLGGGAGKVKQLFGQLIWRAK